MLAAGQFIRRKAGRFTLLEQRISLSTGTCPDRDLQKHGGRALSPVASHRTAAIISVGDASMSK